MTGLQPFLVGMRDRRNARRGGDEQDVAWRRRGKGKAQEEDNLVDNRNMKPPCWSAACEVARDDDTDDFQVFNDILRSPCMCTIELN